MVLIHDGVLHSAAWDDVWPALCRSFRVVRYDRRGYGRSPEAQAPYSPLDDLQAVMGAAEIKHAVLVGASNGGGLAVDFTLAHPGEVDRLVLVGPEVTGVQHSRYFIGRLVELQGRLARGDVAGALRNSWAFAPGDDANMARLLKLEAANPQDMQHKDPALPLPPAVGRLGEIRAPTLLVVGESDQPDNHASAGVVEHAIPGATRVVVPGAGHLVYMAKPAEFSELVTRFAENLPSPGTEEALRRVIGEFQRGEPDYSRMSAYLGGVVRSQIGAIKHLQAANGPLKSITFKGPGGDGDDVFVVAYEHSTGEVRIALDAEGRIMDLRPGRAP